MKSFDDLLRGVLDAFRANDHAITEELELTVEAEVRRLYGGQEYYVGKDIKRKDSVREKVVRDAMTTMSTEEITRKHGISRATMYRLLKRPDKA